MHTKSSFISNGVDDIPNTKLGMKISMKMYKHESNLIPSNPWKI